MNRLSARPSNLQSHHPETQKTQVNAIPKSGAMTTTTGQSGQKPNQKTITSKTKENSTNETKLSAHKKRQTNNKPPKAKKQTPPNPHLKKQRQQTKKPDLIKKTKTSLKSTHSQTSPCKPQKRQPHKTVQHKSWSKLKKPTTIQTQQKP